MSIEPFSYMLLGGAAMIAAQSAWHWVKTPKLTDETEAAEERADPTFPPREIDLKHASVRERLSRAISGIGITGDANIRGGFVVETIRPELLDPSLSAMRVAVAALLAKVTIKRTIGKDLYYLAPTENPLPGAPESEPRLADIQVDDLTALIAVVERVAEERKRSRSLYRGMTEDEITALARTALRAYYTDDGEFGDANAVTTGALDKTRDMAICRSLIETVFLVKGASA